MKPAFVFEPDLCTGCEACRVACGNENNGGHDTGWRQVMTFNPERHPALPTLHLSLACNHCQVPACANGCPARAYRRDEATGAVLIDEAKCIGCRYCSWVCPYDAPRFDAQAGVMTKCTFCEQRLQSDDAPACVAACPTGALRMGERAAAPAEPCFSGLGSWGLGPALEVVQPRRSAPPEGAFPDDNGAGMPPSFPPRQRKIMPGSEKSLVAFTLIVPALAAWFAGGLRVPENAPSLVPFTLVAALAFAISTSHLGKPFRAWRAILGLSTSWLSREIVASGAFVALAISALAIPDPPRALGIAALVAAALAVFAMDGVYFVIPRVNERRLQGSETTATFLLLAGIAAALPWIAVPVGAVKILFVAVRWRSGRLGMARWRAVLRIGLLGMALAMALLSLSWLAAFGLAVASEALDRASFYALLEPSTPSARMEAEARAALGSW